MRGRARPGGCLAGGLTPTLPLRSLPACQGPRRPAPACAGTPLGWAAAGCAPTWLRLAITCVMHRPGVEGLPVVQSHACWGRASGLARSGERTGGAAGDGAVGDAPAGGARVCGHGELHGQRAHAGPPLQARRPALGLRGQVAKAKDDRFMRFLHNKAAMDVL